MFLFNNKHDNKNRHVKQTRKERKIAKVVARNEKKYGQPRDAQWFQDKKYFDTLMSKYNRGQRLTSREESWLNYNGHRFDY